MRKLLSAIRRSLIWGVFPLYRNTSENQRCLTFKFISTNDFVVQVECVDVEHILPGRNCDWTPPMARVPYVRGRPGYRRPTKQLWGPCRIS